MLTLPADPEQVPEARAFARRLLGPQHPCADTVALLLSELVTNAVLHSRSALMGGQVSIAITRSRTAVLVEVSDDGSDTMPSLHPASGRGEHGFGLALVEALAARWGCSRNGAESTTCWFEVRAVSLYVRGGPAGASSDEAATVSGGRTGDGEQERTAEELRRGNPDFIVMWGIWSRKYWARHTLTEGWLGEADPRKLQGRMDAIRRAHQNRAQ